MTTQEILENVALRLFECDAVKFGTFTLKSGIESPVYFDLRVIVSFPKLMRDVSELLHAAAVQKSCEFASVCGVPYTALPLATIVAADHDVPMLIRRKEAKGYGTKKLIEGRFSPGDTCLIIEDVVTSGSSVLETVQTLGTEGLVVKDAVVLLDREQGGKQRLQSEGINLHSVLTMSALLDILQRRGVLADDVIARVRSFIRDNNTFSAPPGGDNSVAKTPATKTLTYEERASLCTHPVAKRLFSIMAEKRSNLAFSADVTSSQELLKLVESVAPHVCAVKTHVDIVEDFSPEVTRRLRALADKHNFLLFEDRKFADIGNTAQRQCAGGVYRISQWADVINAHALPGPGVLTGLKQAVEGRDCGCLLIAEMSSQGNLCTGEYTQATVRLAAEHADFVMGFICVRRVTDDPRFVHITPGVQLAGGGDALGQQYTTPDDVIRSRGSDVIIVGRGILAAPDAAQAALRYREAGWAAHRAALEQQ